MAYHPDNTRPVNITSHVIVWLPVNLGPRVKDHLAAYQRAILTVSEAAKLSQSIGALPDDVAWIGHFPSVQPYLRLIPPAYQAVTLRAAVAAVEHVYRIPKGLRASAEQAGRQRLTGASAIPRRQNPMVANVNRQVVKKNQYPSAVAAEFAMDYLSTHSPAAYAWFTDGNRRHRGALYDLIPGVVLALESPEGFPPLPADGERYTEDELKAIVGYIIDQTGDYERIASEMDAHRKRYDFEAFSMPSRLDTIQTAVYGGRDLLNYQAQLDATLERLTSNLAHYRAIVDATDRLGHDWPDTIRVLTYPTPHKAEKVLNAVNNVEMLAAPLVPYIIRKAFYPREIREMGGWDASLSDLMAKKLEDDADYQRRRKLYDDARHRDLTVLRQAFTPLLALDRPITLADVSKRLPAGFGATTDREGAAQLTTPSGYHPSESHGTGRWDKLVRQTLAREWRS